MKLLLVRNAESEWNKEGILQGHQDSALTQDGRKQCSVLSDVLKQQHFDVAFSSDLGRAIDTAKAILVHHPSVVLERKSLLRERSHGIVQGKTQKEVFREYPQLQRERLKDKFAFKNPKGESYADALERLKPFWTELNENFAGKTVLIVAHSAINRLLLGLALGLEPKEQLEIDQPHECVYVVEHASVSRLSPGGLEPGLLKRQQLKKIPKMDEDALDDDVGLEDD